MSAEYFLDHHAPVIRMLLCKCLGSEILEVSGCRVCADQPGHLYFIFNSTSIPSFAITYYYLNIFDSQTQIAHTNILVDITRVSSVIGFVSRQSIHTKYPSAVARITTSAPANCAIPRPSLPINMTGPGKCTHQNVSTPFGIDCCNYVPFTSPVKPVSPYWKPNSPCLVL